MRLNIFFSKFCFRYSNTFNKSKSTDFLKCFENSISLKAVKVAQEANRRFVDDYDYSGEDKKKERKREKSSDRKNDDKEPRKKRRK